MCNVHGPVIPPRAVPSRIVAVLTATAELVPTGRDRVLSCQGVARTYHLDLEQPGGARLAKHVLL